MKISKNQKGFGAIEGLLIVVIIGLIGVVGYYVYKTNKADIKVPDSSINTTKSALKDPAEGDYFTFKDLGVKIKATQQLQGLKYFYLDGSEFFTSDELNTKHEECNNIKSSDKNVYNAETPPAYSSIAASKKSGQFPEKPTLDDGFLLKQFDGFYIAGYVSTGGPDCTATEDGQPDAAKLKAFKDSYASFNQAVIEAFKTAEQL